MSVKGNKITEEAGPNYLIELNKSFISLFTFIASCKVKQTYVMSHFGRNIPNLAKFTELKFRKSFRFIT